MSAQRATLFMPHLPPTNWHISITNRLIVAVESVSRKDLLTAASCRQDKVGFVRA